MSSTDLKLGHKEIFEKNILQIFPYFVTFHIFPDQNIPSALSVYIPLTLCEYLKYAFFTFFSLTIYLMISW